MIKVQDLTKIYKSKNRTSCMALDHVSFTLPDNGMVFVLGKSGSGKSTLLNLLGGLDEFEEGEIFFEDEQLSRFTQKDFYDYRCRHIGFVFQDFHLLEELTVEENIALVFDLENAEYGDKIQTALQKVGMDQYASRYPRELSGGQKQRVAMARAIAKNPEVILCDEPTGNLDADNSRQILNLLKEFSKTKLVIIVSHNIPDAEAYADRILELRDGKMMRDDVRRDGYSNAFNINEEGTLTLPYNKTLSVDQIDDMVEGIRSGDVKKVVQNDDGFQKVGKIEFRGRPYSRRKGGMSFKDTLRLTKTMMRNQYMRFLLTALTATLIVSCFSVFQSFLHYNINSSISSQMIKNDFPVIAYQKAVPFGGDNSLLNVDSLIHITDEDFAAFRNTAYGDRMHILYDHALPVAANASDVIGAKKPRNGVQNISVFYIYETYGVLQCDMQLLKHVFGDDVASDSRVLAGNIDCPNNGIIITDYVADSIIYGNPHYSDYDSIIGVYRSPGNYKYGVIDAIIKTDYSEKYKDIKAHMEYLMEHGTHAERTDYIASDEYLCFAEQVQLVYGISYSLSEDYIADMSSSTDFLEIGFPGKIQFDFGDGSKSAGTSLYEASKAGIELAPGEIAIPIALFNSICSTAYREEDIEGFDPIEVEITIGSRSGATLSKETYTVKYLLKEGGGIYLNEDDLLSLRPALTSPYAVYFDDVKAATVLNKVADERHFVVRNVENDVAVRLDRLIITFSDLFRLFEAFLLAICIIYMSAFGANVIQRHKYQVGIIKSLGGKTSQIARIFLAQPLIVGGFIVGLSGFGVWGATAAANAILLNSMRSHMELEIRHFNVIEFIPSLVVIDLILVVLLTMVSALAPIWAVHKIKPINIIKAKE